MAAMIADGELMGLVSRLVKSVDVYKLPFGFLMNNRGYEGTPIDELSRYHYTLAPPGGICV